MSREPGTTDRPTIRHRFGPSLWKPAYSLTWDWDNIRWVEQLEPERGKALTMKEFLDR